MSSNQMMNADQTVINRAMEAGEEQQVCDLVVRVFSDFVAPLYSPEGVHEFLTYAADPGQLRSRLLPIALSWWRISRAGSWEPSRCATATT